MSKHSNFKDWDSDEFDTEAMAIDDRNGNFSPENAEDYRHENIVRASFVNGQFSQARRQCADFGLDYEVELHKFTEATRCAMSYCTEHNRRICDECGVCQSEPHRKGCSLANKDYTFRLTLTDRERTGLGRRDLNAATRRYIRRKEKYLNRRCRKIWRAVNPKGEAFTFASFCRDRDRLIVTLEAYVPTVGWIVSH